MKKTTHSRSDTLQALYERYVGDDPERVAAYERAVADADVATQIYQLRTQAGLSQRELAARIGTTASVICRLEDADYDGHSLAMLRRIAAAVGKRVEVRFVPVPAGGAAEETAADRRKSATPRRRAKPAE
jgi:ribosome-binding protein aMBF1 (putative translation factor)